MTPRDYQERVLNELIDWFVRNPQGNAIVAACVGAGKSHMIAHLCQYALQNWPETRIIMTVASRELCRQNLEKLFAIWPDAPAGLNSAGLGRRDVADQILYTTIDSVYRIGHELGRCDLLLVDECFTGETLIDTPTGPRPIDSIRPGNRVCNAIGVGTVLGASKRHTSSTMKVRLSNGTIVECTANHPFFTSRGWVKANALGIGEKLISRAALQAMWSGVSPMEEPIQRTTECPTGSIVQQTAVLLDILLEEAREPNEQQSASIEDARNASANQTLSDSPGGQWMPTSDCSIGVAARAWIGMEGRGCSPHENASELGLPDLLQAGYCVRNSDDWNRVRRKYALRFAEGHRPEENGLANKLWVEGIEIVERGSNAVVYNLHVDGHPSYFANGALVHNCHLIGETEAGKYRQFIAALMKYNPAMRVVGWTGTDFRGNGIFLTQQDEPIFHGVASRVTMRELLDRGFLAPLVSGGATRKIDSSGVSLSGGDFVVHEIAARADQQAIIEAAIDEALTLAADRQRWLVYCVTIEHAEHVRDEFARRGVACALVHGKTPKVERDQAIEGLKSGRLRVLVNVAVLTTGVDIPTVDCIMLLRPMRSPVLYVQIMGRGMRTAPGKTDCMVLDYTDTVAVLGPVDQIKGRGKKPKAEDARAPIKYCQLCGSINPASATMCSSCGIEFAKPDLVSHRSQASGAEVMSKPADWAQVADIRYAAHHKAGSPPTLRVDYYSGLRREASEWVCLEHPGYARKKAEQWWSQRAYSDAPLSVDEALSEAGALKRPKEILVNREEKYPRIIGVKF